METRSRFIDCLLGALRQLEEQLCLILAMRADFFSKCIEQNYSGLAQLIQEKLVAVSPMEREQLQQAIVKPAERVNLEIEPELVEQMLQDVAGSPGSLPLLQYTLKELWKRRTDQGLQLASYAQLGGVGGTLDKRATEIFQQFPQPKQEVARHIFLGLTQLGEGTEDTRRRVLKQDLITAKHPEALIDEVIAELADKENRLIVTSELTAKGKASGEVVVDVAHEALIRNWRLLRQWLDENRDKLREQRKLEAAANEWRNKQQENSKIAKDYLLQGMRLREAREFQQKQSQEFPLSDLAGNFLRVSTRQQWSSRLKAIAVFSIIPVVLTLIINSEELRRSVYEQILKTCKETPGSCLGRIQALEALAKAGKDLKSINLKEANLRGAKLNDTDLRGARLNDANLKKANLRYADLRGANLSNANLIKANLGGVNLGGANLSDADLSDADLSNADLRGVQINEATQLDDKWHIVWTILNQATPKRNLKVTDLSNANLSGADLGHCQASVNLWGTDTQ